MKKIVIVAVLLLAVKGVFVSCNLGDKGKQSDEDSCALISRPKDSLLYKTINDFTKMIDSTSTNKRINILGVYSEKNENGDYDIVLVGTPSYSHEYEFATDSLIFSYAIVNDWLICINLHPEVFNIFKSSFTFVDPNQYPQFHKHFEGCFEPVSWHYQFQNDSLVFIKRVLH